MPGGIRGNQVVTAGTRLSGSHALRIVLCVWEIPQRLSKAEMLWQWQNGTLLSQRRSAGLEMKLQESGL